MKNEKNFKKNPPTRRRDERRFGNEQARPQNFQRRENFIANEVKEEDSGAKVYGIAPVLEVLRAGKRSIERLTIAEDLPNQRLRDLFDLANENGIIINRAPRFAIQKTVPEGVNTQGVVAFLASAKYADEDELLDKISAKIGTENPPLAVVLDGVEDPRNLGAIARTVECAGADGIFIPERRAVGLTETVSKTSAGALEYVPVARVTNLNNLIRNLKARNIWTIGTSISATTDYTDWDWTQPSALILGSEGKGLHQSVEKNCDVLVKIPLFGKIESLNVSVAAGIVLYEALRQRKNKSSKSDEK
jgi:23S rRNA (guanosine2251-2'-O)-methyltransferase